METTTIPKPRKKLRKNGLSTTTLWPLSSMPIESIGYNEELSRLSVLLNPRPYYGTSEDGVADWGPRQGKRTLYIYQDVPKDIYDRIVTDDFPGATFVRLIKPFKYDRIEFAYDFATAARAAY